MSLQLELRVTESWKVRQKLISIWLRETRWMEADCVLEELTNNRKP